ncbi:MAG TPA: hypothetical protein VLF41_01335 [Candidatus Nanoarchaeia archaeon]|nr:hypothetical protein [Candidatus Nanoarchaeia archaeon]
MKKWLIAALVVLLMPSATFALTADERHSINYDSVWYQPGRAGCNSNATTISGGSLVRFLQTLAFKESGGNPTAQAKTSDASGKYQYLNSTWVAHSRQYYLPGANYPRAMLAPETTQDAVAYLEYSDKFKIFGGDLFKMAVSHYLPAALSNPSLMDTIPSGNVITPRQYGNSFVQSINKGDGANIPINPLPAPDFATYAQKLGAPLPTATDNSATVNTTSGCASNGAVAGNIVQTALNYAWPNHDGHNGPNSATPAYQAAWAKYDGQSDMTDCGAFVATVMISSGVDPNYPKVGTGVQLPYLKSHPDKYIIIEHPTNTSQLQPGDILIYTDSGEGHTMIYIGPQTGGYSAVDASLHGHTPQAQSNPASMFSQPGIILARIRA